MSLVHYDTGRTAKLAPPRNDRSMGVGQISRQMVAKIEELRKPTPTFAFERPTVQALSERLFDALAAFKINTAQVAMHLDRDWRFKLFRQLDSLLDANDWDVEDPPPQLASYMTFLRMLTFLKPKRRPGLGASHSGQMIATWDRGSDRLTMECLPNDLVRWSLKVTIDGDEERAAAITPVSRLPDVLAPYAPARWFDDAYNLPAG